MEAAFGVTKWSPEKKFHVTKLASKNTVDEEKTNRGQIIVRLIKSTRGHVIRGLDLGVQHMTLGETATIKVRYDYAYGSNWMGSTLPPRANIIFTVKLLTINGR